MHSMDIVLYIPGMPFDGRTLEQGASLGGSESAGYYLARELAGRGHRVTVFSALPPGAGGEFGGVTYRPIGPPCEAAPCGAHFEAWAAATPHDVLIGQRLPGLFHRRYASKVNLWWTHDLALKRNLPALSRGLWNLDAVLCVSRFHKDQVAGVYGLKDQHIVVAPNGVDAALFNGGAGPEAKRRGKRLFYSSRPERGLEHLVGLEGGPPGIMERLHAADPEVTLQVCGYDNTTPELAGYYAALAGRCRRLPNVEWLGPLSKTALAQAMEEAWLHLYPTTFEEVSCITVMEAMCAGTPVVTSPVAALPETLRDAGAHWVPLTEDGAVHREGFVHAVVSLRDDPERYRRLHRIALEKAPNYRWSHAADAVEATVAAALRGQCAQPGRLARHLLRMSDIGALRAHLAAHPLNSEAAEGAGREPQESDTEANALAGDDALVAAARAELERCYAFAEGAFADPAAEDQALARHYAAYYAYERGRGVVYGPETLDGQPRFEAVAARLAAHIDGRAARLAAHIDGRAARPAERPRGRKEQDHNTRPVLLDYGCAHGHYTINLARRFPQANFIGIDLADSNIETARRWAGEEGLDNVEFFAGALAGHAAALPALDAVLAAEVLEHVPHPAALADALAAHLKPGGLMLLTTPFGPWEAQGYALHHPWRAHLHHLERADLEELFGHHPGFFSAAVPAGATARDEALGSWLTGYCKPAQSSGSIDMARKLSTQAPRQTLSVCMLVTPDGDTLARCLKSVAPIADEIILGIDDIGEGDATGGGGGRDESRRGRAWTLATEFGARAFSVTPPLRQGFDAARNATVERASGDWVLWIDDDEELLWPERLPKYLRHNGYDAYALAQHHYAVEPGGVLKTDYPCRLFRNRAGFRFHGLVHEHPERGLNQGAGAVLLLPDLAICHNGYVTEEVRRERFLRNLPLMRRDRERNADRLLGRFLWIRDLAHLNRFEFEQTGAVSPEMRARAQEAVALWRGLLADHQPRMAVDALPYYSEAADLLTGGGIDYALQLGIHRHGLGDPPGQPGAAVQGRFMDTSDIRNLTGALLAEKTGLVEGKYV